MELKWSIATLLAGICLTPALAKQAAKNNPQSKPNVVIIVIDDMGWKQLSCYGSKFYQSPNIDQLAENGVRFTNAYASAPVCSPTRAALMTGKYPARLHLTDYIPGTNPTEKILLTPDWQKYLPVEETTIAEVMKSAGYRTALFGKWHLSREKDGPESLPNNPDKQGFDETFLTLKPASDRAITPWQKPEIDGHSTDTIMSRSVEFIHRNKQFPFLMVVSFDAIHDPLMERKASIQKYKNDPDSNLPENNPVLGAMVERVDKAVGRLMDCLHQDKLTDNTIVVLISDNGGLEKSASQQPLKHGKGWLYEGGIRVPMMVSWKGKIKPGRESEQPVATIDILPTILDLAGIQNNLPVVDGISIVPVLKENISLERETLYWNYPHYHNGPPSAAIRKGNYKLIEWYEKSLTNQTGAFELYDLSKDMSETNDLASKYPELVNQMKMELADWRKSVGAQVPLINTK